MTKTLRFFSLAVTFLTIFVLLTTVSFSNKSPEDQRVKNMKTFARLYGYVKYFYPGDEAASMDWDRFAIYGAQKVEQAKNKDELKKNLEELFLPVAPALLIHDANEKMKFSAAKITPRETKDKKVVAWQHNGVGFGKRRSTYKSIRLNRKNKIPPEVSFGTITGSIDPKPLKGKKIKFKAAVNVSEGRGQLWLRVDRPDRQPGFFDNMGDRPIKTNQWKYYEIEGEVADDAVGLYFGCLTKGAGKLWVDDFQLYVKEGEEWKRVKIKNPDFENDKEGTAPAQWITKSPSYEYAVTSETAAKGTKSVSLKSQEKVEYFTGELFEAKPSFGEHISKNLGGGLSCIMPIALYGTEEQTYPPAVEADLKALNAAMDQKIPRELTEMSGNDLYVRLGNVVNSWNVFQHFFPYFDVVKTDWNASLTEALKGAYNDNTEQDFLKTLQKFTAGLKDGHVRVRLRGKKGQSKFFFLPLAWEWIENQLVITVVYDKSLIDVGVGDVVKEIDGVKAADVLEKEKAFISAATEGWKMYRALSAMTARQDQSEARLKIERNKNETVEAVIKPILSTEYFQFFQNWRNRVLSKKIKDGIYYLNIDRIPMEQINALMPELEKARAIICDLRGYPNGNHNLISHLLKEKDTSKEWMWVPHVIYPDYEKVTFRKTGWQVEPLKPRLTAKIFFLVDGRAISYAESYMGLIEHYKLATIVGQTTAGTNGNVNPFTLPGGYYLSWTGMRVVKHDGSQHHGVGIIPDVPVDRTIEGVRAGRDEFLEKAIELAEK
ncbi:MAG: peptidase S41 [bacterium]|nr:peptidase S41 [bacterium]